MKVSNPSLQSERVGGHTDLYKTNNIYKQDKKKPIDSVVPLRQTDGFPIWFWFSRK